ncbi:MAG: TetR/AcrR family transcriptional regulator, partial [Haloechinothrix sp.]
MMPAAGKAETRTWAGTTLADRRAARRRQLLDAGLELVGPDGTAAVSVRAACRTAKLTERYFYENFTDRDALLLAVYDHVGAQARDALIAAVRDAPARSAEVVRAAVTAFVELILDDPRKGTVLLLAPLTDPALTPKGAELLPAFAALIHDQLPPEIDEGERQMIAVGLVGALTHLFISYLNGTLDVPRDQLVEHCVHM